MGEARRTNLALVPPLVDESGRRILVVEEEPLLRKVIGSLLVEDGRAVETVGSAREANAAFWANPQAYDLVLVDVDLAEDNGAALVEYLAACRPDLPFLVLGSAARRPELQCAGGGARCVFLRKPLAPDELILAVRGAVGTGAAADGPEDSSGMDLVHVRELLRDAVASAGN